MIPEVREGRLVIQPTALVAYIELIDPKREEASR